MKSKELFEKAESVKNFTETYTTKGVLMKYQLAYNNMKQAYKTREQEIKDAIKAIPLIYNESDIDVSPISEYLEKKLFGDDK